MQEACLSASVIGFSTTESHRRVKVPPACSAVCCITQESYINQMCRLISGSINLLVSRPRIFYVYFILLVAANVKALQDGMHAHCVFSFHSFYMTMITWYGAQKKKPYSEKTMAQGMVILLKQGKYIFPKSTTNNLWFI